jgi:hypothetical protein
MTCCPAGWLCAAHDQAEKKGVVKKKVNKVVRVRKNSTFKGIKVTDAATKKQVKKMVARCARPAFATARNCLAMPAAPTAQPVSDSDEKTSVVCVAEPKRQLSHLYKLLDSPAALREAAAAGHASPATGPLRAWAGSRSCSVA